MKTYGNVIEKRVVEITCDRCGKTCDLYYNPGNPEAAEFLSYNDVGGYASPHGDGTRWSIDLCAPCTIEVLGEWIVRKLDHD